MSGNGAPEPTILHFDAIDWADESSTGAPADLVAEAARLGARRKKMATGQAGFYMNHSSMPPGFVVPEHAHSHDELIVVLAGSCTLMGSGQTLAARDAIVLHGGYRYGFTCGAEGMSFLTIRTGEATTDVTG